MPVPVNAATIAHSLRRKRPRWQAALAVTVLNAWLSACADHRPQRLHCDDLVPAEAVDFQILVDLALSDPNKGCTEGSCHNKEVQQGHLRLDTPELLFEEFSSNPELNYALLATGAMPEHGTVWNESDLQMFRSWYCYGAVSQ